MPKLIVMTIRLPVALTLASLLPGSLPAVAANGTSAAPAARPWFASSTTFGVGSDAKSVVIGDFTGDGRGDVALTTGFYTSGSDVGKVYLYRQGPNGALEAPIKLDSHIRNGDDAGIAAGDLNGDGLTDLAVATFDGVDVFLQSGGTLSPASLAPTSSGAREVEIGDADGDGDQDLFVRSQGKTLLLKNSAGVFAETTAVTASQGEIEIGDTTGDDRLDVVIMWQRTVRLYRQQPDGTFAASDAHELPLAGGSANGLELGDVTDDGLIDAVVTGGGNSPTGQLHVFPQTGEGTLVGPIVHPSYDIPETVVAADVNGDGKGDIVTVHGGWRALGVYVQGEVIHGLERRFPVPPASHYGAQGLDVGDISGDGLADIVLADSNHGLVVLRQITERDGRKTKTGGKLLGSDRRRGRYQLYGAGERAIYEVRSRPASRGNIETVLEARIAGAWLEAFRAPFRLGKGGRAGILVGKLPKGSLLRIAASFQGTGKLAPSATRWSYLRAGRGS